MLLAAGRCVLRGDDLPAPVPLEPSVCPNVGFGLLLSIGGFTDGTFRSVNDSYVVAEEVDFRIIQAALAELKSRRFLSFNSFRL